MDRGAVDAFYSGLNSSLIDPRGHLKKGSCSAPQGRDLNLAQDC